MRVRWTVDARSVVRGESGFSARGLAPENEFYFLLSDRRSVAFGSRIALGSGFDVLGGNKRE